MVATDGSREVKASKIEPEASRYRLERRLGPYTDYRARQAVASCTLDERTPLRSVEDRVRRLRESVCGPAGLAQATIPRRIKQALPERVRVPAARVEHRRIATSYREAAVRTLQDRPQAFGALRQRVAPDPARVRDAAKEAYRWAGRIEARGRPELRCAAAEHPRSGPA